MKKSKQLCYIAKQLFHTTKPIDAHRERGRQTWSTVQSEVPQVSLRSTPSNTNLRGFRSNQRISDMNNIRTDDQSKLSIDLIFVSENIFYKILLPHSKST